MFRYIVITLILGGAMVVRHLETSNQSTNQGTVALSAPVPASPSPAGRNVVLTKSSNGHFEVEARVDGRRLELLVDTGASHIALRESAAARLGIYPRPSDYTVRVSTANGVTKAALVHLRSVEVGDIVVRDVRRSCIPTKA